MNPRNRSLLVVAACLAAVATVPGAAGQAAPAPYRGTQAASAIEDAHAAYQEAQERVAGLSAQTSRLRADAESAAARAERLHDQVAGDSGGLLSAVGDLLGSGPSDLDRAADAADTAEFADQLAARAETALATAIADTERLRLAWERAERRRARTEAAWTAAEAADAAIRRSRLAPSYDVTDPAQDRRNRSALAAWHDYLHQLAHEAVVPPALADLAEPARLPAPLEPLRDVHNETSPGVAAVDPTDGPEVTVVSAEAVRAVSEAFRRIGLRAVPGAVEPAAYACGGLVANAWDSVVLPADVAGQWDQLRTVPVGSVQAGDLVVLGSRSSGVGVTGVYVGRDLAITADPATGVAGVRVLDDDEILGARRPGVPGGDHAAPPRGGPCAGDSATTTVPGSGPLVVPVAEGAFHLTADFGTPGERWSSGEHTGLDFAAPVGTPVVAAAGGTVTVEHPAWAGSLVRIDHGGGVETWYAHLSRTDVVTGQVLDAGDQLGLVGERGNASGPHVHVEVRLDGAAYDPAQVFTLTERPRPTYSNGEVPDAALCPATPDGLQLLRCDAAVAYRLLGAAYARAFGEDLCITDSYRSRSGQERVFATKPGLAAIPGTSVHGLGLAVDLCGGIETFGSTENDWLLAHGADFGWLHPSWAAAGGSRPEPWHFEYADG